MTQVGDFLHSNSDQAVERAWCLAYAARGITVVTARKRWLQRMSRKISSLFNTDVAEADIFDLVVFTSEQASLWKLA